MLSIFNTNITSMSENKDFYTRLLISVLYKVSMNQWSNANKKDYELLKVQAFKS